MNACDCNAGLSNLGYADCVSIMDIAKKMAIVQTRDSAGAYNSIDLTDTLDDAYFTARVNDPDKSKRWFITESFDNVVDERGESVFFTLDSGKQLFLKDGERTFNAIFAETGNDPVYLGKLESAKCSQLSVFFFDESDNIIGNGVIEDGFLRPIRMARGSFDPGLVKAQQSGGNSQYVGLQFSFSSLEKDSSLRHIQASDIDASVCALEGLKDVNVAISTTVPPTTTTARATLTLDYGFGASAILVEGLVLADFDLNQKSPTVATATLSSVTEVTPGVYDIVFTTETSGDVLQLDVVKDGFESKSNDITIP